MEDKKKELHELIDSMQSEKMVDYILEFSKHAILCYGNKTDRPKREYEK